MPKLLLKQISNVSKLFLMLFTICSLWKNNPNKFQRGAFSGDRSGESRTGLASAHEKRTVSLRAAASDGRKTGAGVPPRQTKDRTQKQFGSRQPELRADDALGLRVGRAKIENGDRPAVGTGRRSPLSGIDRQNQNRAA